MKIICFLFSLLIVTAIGALFGFLTKAYISGAIVAAIFILYFSERHKE